MDWSIELTGHRFDLEELPKWLDGGDFEVVADNGKFFLRSARFDTLNAAAEVRRAAEEVVELLNGLGRLQWPEFRPVSVGAVHSAAGDGRTQVYVSITETITARDKATATVINSDGSVQPPPDLGRLNPWVGIVEADDLVQRALGYLNRDQITWNDLYRALEVVESDVGGHVYEAGWASKSETERFNRTANSYSVLKHDARHGRDRGDPPPNPMKFEEADQLVRKVVRAWIEEKAARKRS